jgi:hypothetical protein
LEYPPTHLRQEADHDHLEPYKLRPIYRRHPPVWCLRFLRICGATEKGRFDAAGATLDHTSGFLGYNREMFLLELKTVEPPETNIGEAGTVRMIRWTLQNLVTSSSLS